LHIVSADVKADTVVMSDGRYATLWLPERPLIGDWMTFAGDLIS